MKVGDLVLVVSDDHTPGTEGLGILIEKRPRTDLEWWQIYQGGRTFEWPEIHLLVVANEGR